MSMGSLSGADIWMVGVRMGTVRGAIGSSLPCPSPSSDLCGLSITCAICAWKDKAVSIWSRTAGGERDGGWCSIRREWTGRSTEAAPRVSWATRPGSWKLEAGRGKRALTGTGLKHTA